MTEEAFKRWVEKMEGEYEKKKADKNGSFAQWLERIKESNENIKADFLKYGLEPNKFIALKIAEVFYPDLIVNGKLKSGTQFNNDKDYGKAIKYALENGLKLNRVDRFVNGNQDSENKIEKKNNTWYWIEICSALQKNYSIFANIKDINEFLTKVASQSNNNDLSDYGLYVRDIHDLCIAYAILHGYSFEETQEIIFNCQKIVEEKRKETEHRPDSNSTVTPSMLKTFDDKSNGLLQISKNDFYNKVEYRAKDFLPIGVKRHLTSYREFLKRNTRKQDREEIQKESDFNIIIGYIYDCLPELENVANKSGEKIKTLKDFILDKLKVAIAIKQGKYGAYAKFEESIPWLRRYCIVLQLKNAVDGNLDNKQIILEDSINYELENLNLRTIAYEPDDDVEIINTTTDLFDWFIIECLNFDAQIHNGGDGEGISGYKPFCKFLGIELYEEEY